MKLSGLVFHPKASSCPRNQWQPRNGLTFLSRSCLRQISQNDPCTFQNLANYLNCCFCIEQSLIIKDRYYCSVKKNSAVTEKYQIFTLFSWIIVIVMVIIVLLRLLYTAFKGLLYSWLYSMNGEYFQFIWTFINSSLSWNQKDIFSKSSRWRKIIGNFRIRKGISLWRVSIWVANFPWLKSSLVMQPGKHYTARPWPNFYHTCHNCFTNAWLWALCVYISAFYIADAWGALQIRWHCNNTLLRGGMYWKIRLPTWARPLIEEKKTSHWALLAACCFCSYLLQSQPTQTAKFTDVQNETGDGKCIRKGVQSSNILSFCVETKSSFSPG